MRESVRLSFEKSPYRWSILGTPDTISAISRDELYDYYIHRYTPENMVLVIVGGIREKDILPRLEEKFGTINRSKSTASSSSSSRESVRKSSESIRDDETVRTYGYRREYKKPVKESYIIFTFPGPDLSIPREVYACDLLSIILGEGRSSRLYRKIKEEQNLVSSIMSSYSTHRRDGLFIIFATFDYTLKDKLIDAVLDEVRQIVEHEVTQEEIQKAKRMLTNQTIFSQETTNGRSAEIGFYYTLTGDTKFQQTYLEKIMAVTPDEIRDLAIRYLEPENVNIFIGKPE
jgi:zinc protease